MLLYDNLEGLTALSELQKVRLHNVVTQDNFTTPEAKGLLQYVMPSNDVWLHVGSGTWKRLVMSGDTAAAAQLSLTNLRVWTGNSSNLPVEVDRSAIPVSSWGGANQDINMGSNKITGLADPVASTDAANKAYVDSAVQGLAAKDSCKLATNQALPACTYSNGSLTLTGNVNGALSSTAVDSGGGAVTLAVDMRILVKTQATAEQNGIYKVTTVGSGGTPFVLTRTLDANTNGELVSAFTFIESGTSANTGYVQTSTDYDITAISTKSISWSLFSSAGSFVAGKGLILTGGTTFNFAKSTAYAQGDLFYGITGGSGESATTKIEILTLAAAGKLMQVNSGATAPSWSAFTLPLTAPGNSSILRGSGGNWTEVTSVASSVMLTDISGNLYWGQHLPAGITSNGAYIYRVGGTDVALTDGGTGASLVPVDGGIVYSNAVGMAISAAGTSGYFVRAGGTGSPTFYDLLGGSNNWAGTQNYRNVTPTWVFGAYKITTDPTNRIELLANGKINFGDGSVTPYVTLTGATTVDVLSVTGGLELRPLNGITRNLFFWDDDASNRVSLRVRSVVTANKDWYLPHLDVANGIWQSDGSGQLTCALITPASITSGAAMTTGAVDPNVLVTLGNTPSTALLAPVSITMGWNGQLSVARGGTGLSSFTVNAVMYGNGSSIGFATSTADTVLACAGANPLFSGQPTLSTGIITKGQQAVRITPFGVVAGNTGEIQFLELAANGNSYVGFKGPNSITAGNTIWTLPASDAAGVFRSNGAGIMSLSPIVASDVGSGAALSGGVADPNVLITVGGGSASVLSATTLTMGWNGTLSVARGGTGQGSALTVGGLIFASSGTAMSCMTAPSLTGVIPRATVGDTPTWTSYTMPASLTGANRLFVSSSATAVAELAPTANRLLSTDGSSVISWGAILNVARNTAGGIARKWSNLVAGDNVNSYIWVAHNLNTRDVVVSVRNSNSGDTGAREIGYTKVTVEDANTVRVYFNAIQTPSNYYVVTVIG